MSFSNVTLFMGICVMKLALLSYLKLTLLTFLRKITVSVPKIECLMFYFVTREVLFLVQKLECDSQRCHEGMKLIRFCVLVAPHAH